jgi:hypothetical protein
MIMNGSSSETLARRHIPKYRNFDAHRRESPKCHIYYVALKEMIRKIFGPKEDKVNEQFKMSNDNTRR